MSVFPTGIDYLLQERIVKNGEIITIGVKHGLFSSYYFVFETISDTSKKINKPRYKVSASSNYLRKTFPIKQFIFEDSIKGVSGLQFKFSDKFVVLNNEIYAIGAIVKNAYPHERKEVLLKMSIDPRNENIFDIFIYKDNKSTELELKNFQIKGNPLLKIKF